MFCVYKTIHLYFFYFFFSENKKEPHFRMKPVKDGVRKKAVATYKPEMFKDIFGPTTNTISTSVSAPKRFGSSLKKMNIPKKKKIVEDSQGPVNIMDDINKTINKQEEASYECPFCFEELVPPYPEELRKAIEETKKKQSMLEETQRKNYETKVIKEKAEGKVYIEPFMLDKESLSEHDRKIVCHMHKMELELKPLARERGYPEHIDFDSLKSRIEGFKSDLLDIIHGQVESDYFLEEKRKIKQLGANKARDTAELINYFQHTLVNIKKMIAVNIYCYYFSVAWLLWYERNGDYYEDSRRLVSREGT